MKIEKPPFPIEDFRLLIQTAFPCTCASRQLVSRRDSRGRLLLHEQCPECGKLFRRQLPHTVAAGLPLDSLPEWNEQHADSYSAAYAKACGELQSRFNDARQRKWWEDYSAYLETDEWRARSRACIERAGGVCLVCRRRPATQAHHTTYERVGNEENGDLQAACIPCHNYLHNR